MKPTISLCLSSTKLIISASRPIVAKPPASISQPSIFCWESLRKQGMTSPSMTV